MKRLGNRRVLGWWLFALLLACLAWALYVMLPPEPRWVLRGSLGAGVLTPDGKTYVTRTVNAAELDNLSDWFARPTTPVRVGPVQYWNIATGAELHNVLGERGPVWQVGFSTDCQQLAAVAPLRGDTRCSELRWMDLASGRERRATFDRPSASWQPWISPGGGLLLLEDWNDPAQGIYVYETASLRQVTSVKDPRGWRPSWKWTTDGNALYLYTHDTNGDASLGRIAADGQTTIMLKGARDWIEFSPDGKMLLTWSAADDALHLWDLPVGTRRGDIPLHELKLILRSLFTPDSRTLVLIMGRPQVGDTLGVWDVDRAKWLAKVPYAGGAAPFFLGPNAVVVYEDQHRLACYQLRPFAKLWQREGELPRAADYLPDQASFMALSGKHDADIDARLVQFGEPGGRIVLLDARTGTTTLDVALDPEAVYRWHSRGNLFVVTSVENRTSERGRVREFIEDHLLSVFVPNLTGRDNRASSVRVFDMTTGAERCRINLQRAEIDAEALSPDGQTLVLHQRATEGADATIFCYDLPPRRSWQLILGIPSALGVMLLLVRVGSRRMWRRASAAARSNLPASPGGEGAVP
jgi:WD40 repeat protein